MYGVVAKNVLAKVIEEENVKIEMDSPRSAVKTENPESKVLIYSALMLGLLLIVILIILYRIF
jgi:hypothetical protein